MCFLSFSCLILITLSSTMAAPYVTPGAGWDTTTFTPAAVGSPGDDGYDATAIARWDVVPYQDVIDSFNVGVIAFHMNGIEKVSFAVDDGDWVDASAIRLNERTGVWEYFITLRPSDFTEEGKVEVRAIAWPAAAGEPRVLSGMELFIDKGGLSHDTLYVDPVNGNDTQTVAAGGGSADTPFLTIETAISQARQAAVALGGLVLFCEEGSYATPAVSQINYDRWLTVTAAPGADPDSVLFTARGGRCDLQHLKMTDVTWKPSYNTSLYYPAGSDRKGRHFWLDNMQLIGADRLTYGQCQVQEATLYETDLYIYNWSQGVYAINSNIKLVRGVHVEHIKEDAFRVSTMLVNCSVNDADPEGSGAHPDVIQAGGGHYDNFIVYNLKATNVKSQGIYIRGINWAIINTFIQQDPSTGYLWQVDNIDSVQHCLLWHCGTVNQTFTWRTGGGTYNCKNISIRNCAFRTMGCGTNSKGEATDCGYLADTAMVIDNNHFTTDAFNNGTKATIGDPVFSDAGAGDYRPGSGSPLLKRSAAGLVPCDVDNNPRGDTTAVGAFAAVDEQATAIDNRQLTIDKQQHLSVWPNPMGNVINIDRRDAPAGCLRINIYDRTGSLVRAMYPEAIGSASSSGVYPGAGRGHESPLRWDGTNQSGTPVLPGVYYISDSRSVVRIIKTE